MIPTDGPLFPLALQVARRADIAGETPVLTLEQRVGFTGEFWTGLVEALHHAAGRAVRVEVLWTAGGMFGYWRGKQCERLSARIARAIPVGLERAVVVEKRMVLSRPAGPLRPLVVGIAYSHDPLPEWATRLRLTTTPVRTDDFQLVPVP